jgi:hypothetical protein
MRNIRGQVVGLTLVVAAVLAGWSWSGLRSPAAAADAPRSSLAAGTACKVYLRADAAGTSGQYVPNLTNNATLSGKVAAIDDQWMVLVTDKGEFHIARSGILAVEVGK